MSQAFGEESIPPTVASITQALGNAAPVWGQAVAALENAGATVEWRYYRDGGWLAKATVRRRTIAWLRVEPGLLRISFSFAARLRQQLLDEAAVDATIREQILGATGSSIALSMEVGDASALDQVVALIAVKVQAQ